MSRRAPTGSVLVIGRVLVYTDAVLPTAHDLATHIPLTWLRSSLLDVEADDGRLPVPAANGFLVLSGAA